VGVADDARRGIGREWEQCRQYGGQQGFHWSLMKLEPEDCARSVLPGRWRNAGVLID
jgi:hypothetical protein